jgi:hypothetical protein
MSTEDEPHAPPDVDTPEDNDDAFSMASEVPPQGPFVPADRAPEVARRLIDGVEDQEIDFRPNNLPPMHPPRGGLQAQMVGAPLNIKPEPYDGKSDWPEYLVYFEQLSEIYGWDHATMAVVLGISLRESARSVLASLSLAQRRDYTMLKDALTQSFCPTQQIFLYQAELKNRVKKTSESLSDLGRDIIRLSKLAFPSANSETREAVAISAFLDALPGNAMETRMSVLRARPKTMLEVVALAIEVETVVDAGNHRRTQGRRDIHNVDDEKPVAKNTESEKLRKAVEQLTDTVGALHRKQTGPSASRYPAQADRDRKELKCFNCGKTGHFRRECPGPKQGNGGGRPGTQ